MWSVISPRFPLYATEWGSNELDDEVNLTKMATDFLRLYEHYFASPRDLRRSVLHPLRPETAKTILRIIQLRLADPDHNPPLQVFTYGGSVLYGSESYKHDWWLPNATLDPTKQRSDLRFWKFPWPRRLEDMWNNVIFGGRNVVRVHNFGASGISTEIGVLALMYRLFGTAGVLPDVIIHAFGNNDMLQYLDDETVYTQHIQFVEAARQLRCDQAAAAGSDDDDANDSGLPVVVFFDDHVGIDDRNFQKHRLSLRYLRSVAQISTWYDLLAISFPSSFRHVHYAEADRTRLGVTPLVHPWMLYHSGTAPWLLTYGLLSGLVDHCRNEEGGPLHPDRPSDLSRSHIPALEDDVHRPIDVDKLWMNRTLADKDRCVSSNSSSSASSPCISESWVANRIGGINTQKDLRVKLREMKMTNNVGWDANGRSAGSARIGWVTTTVNATFTITVRSDQSPTHLIVVSLKSYGEYWMDSLLRIHTRHPDKDTELGTFEVSGYHTARTSVSYSHKFALDIGKMKPGSPIEARFDLVGGRAFRMVGLLFCSE